MNNNKQQTEDRIETVLAALRHAEPAPGMEQRITAALLRAEASAKPSRWVWLRTPRFAGVVAVLAAGVLLSVHSLRRHDAKPVQGRIATSPVRAVPANQRSLRLAVAHSASPKTKAIDVSRLRPQNRTQAAKPAAGERRLPSEQAQLEQGFPAPPLPLTEQERLLIRLIHRDDPVQLSQLTPAAREARLQRDSEQVREFFKPPPMLAANFTLEPYPTLGGTQ